MVFDWLLGRPYTAHTLVFLAFCTVFVHATVGLPQSSTAMDLGKIREGYAIVVCPLFSLLVASFYMLQRGALRTLPCSSKQIGGLLWMQMVLVAPVWIGLTCAPAFVVGKGVTWPVMLRVPYLAFAGSVAVTGAFVARARARVGGDRRGPATGRATLCAAAGLIVLVAVATLRALPSYWLLPLAAPLAIWTWLDRESLAHLPSRIGGRGSGAFEDAVIGGPRARRFIPWWIRGIAPMSLLEVCLVPPAIWLYHSDLLPTRDIELQFILLLPAISFAERFAFEVRLFKTMRLLPATTAHLFVHTVSRFYVLAGLMAAVATVTCFILRGTFSWAPAALIAAGAGATLVTTVMDLRSARRIPYVRHAVLFAWFMAMTLLILPVSGLLGAGNDFYVGAFVAGTCVALVLNPIGLVLLYRSLDRSPCVYRPLKDGIAGMVHPPNRPSS